MANTEGAETAVGSAQFYFLGPIELDRVSVLQSQIADDLALRASQEIVVLLCEHSKTISIGRMGSRGDIHLTDDELTRRHLQLRWLKRGGSTVLHHEGQLAIYPIVSLRNCGWTVGEFMRRLQLGIGRILQTYCGHIATVDGCLSHWGRTGVLSVTGISVQNWGTSFGVWLNVNPQMADFRFVDAVPLDFRAQPIVLSTPESMNMTSSSTDTAHRKRNGRETLAEIPRRSTMGSLAAECQSAITMPAVRAVAVPTLAEAFDRHRYYLHSGQPYLKDSTGEHRGSRSRVV